MANVTLSYKGNTIGTLSTTGNLTMDTAGKYCEDDILLSYVAPSGGTDVWDLLIDYTDTINLKDDTNFDSMTPSTTAQELLPAVNTISGTQTSATDFDTYSYVGIGLAMIKYAFSEAPSSSNIPKTTIGMTLAHPNKYTRDIVVNSVANLIGGLLYSSGSWTTNNVGIVIGGANFSMDSTNTATPKFGAQRGVVRLQAHNTKFPTDDIAKIDSENTYIVHKYKMWRAPKKAIDTTMYNFIRGELYPS